LRARPKATFGNSIGPQMLEYTKAADGCCTTMRTKNHSLFIFSPISIVGFVLGAILLAAVSRLTQSL
jgi:hypothetical protein